MVEIRIEKYLEVGGTKKLFTFSCSIEGNSILGISGPSGCGKTSLLKIIAGLMESEHANISIGDKVMTNTEKSIETSIDKRRVAMVFQDQALFPNMTMLEHIHFINKGLDLEEVNELILQFGLLEQVNTYPSKLSGGQKQRLAILLALVSKPQLLLLDEPFTALDDKTRDMVLEILRKHINQWKLPVILVSHQTAVLDELCSEVIKLPSL